MKLCNPSVRAGRSLFALTLAATVAGGCTQGPALLPANQRHAIDRALVECPPGYELKPVVRNLSAPTAIAFDQEGSLLIADNGLNDDCRIFGYKTDGTAFDIYPKTLKLPFGISGGKVRLYGPIGGMVAANGKIYVAHRDRNHRGVVTAFDYNGVAQTIVADLPAEGDHGLTDLVFSRVDGRLYFGVGSMTNSGVVGLDNWDVGWVSDAEAACDVPAVAVKLLGYRFDTSNPRQTIFGGKDVAVTAPFQPFGVSNQMWVRPAHSGKSTASIYSVSTAGGDLRLEAHGIRCARGLAFNDFGRLYATNQGMELRGTRPVKDDPDVLLRIIRSTWYGWPDFSADLQSVTEARFQPSSEMIIKTGYPELSILIDHSTSGLMRPDRSTLLQASFTPLSGAAKMDFVPASGPFRGFYGSVLIALSGDHAPFANNGKPLAEPVGFKIVQVDVDNRQTHDFIYNTNRIPAHLGNRNIDSLERPYDVKFGPDGALYILDMGRLDVNDGNFKPVGRSGKILRLDPIGQ